MIDLRVWQLLGIFEFFTLLGAGIWALYVYRTARRNQVAVAVVAEPRLAQEAVADAYVLIVNLAISNASDVLWRYENAVATLFDARKLTPNGPIRLVPFAQADPFLALYGVETDDRGAVQRGEMFEYFEGQEITLEPGEQVVSELAFPLDPDLLGLMAMKVWVSGRQRNRARSRYEWATFFFIDPNECGDRADVVGSGDSA